MKDFLDHLSTGLKHFLDSLSLLTVLGTLVSALPAIAAIFSIVWTSLRIYETNTVQKLLGKKSAK